MQPVTMTRVIGGKRYSTATATLLASDAYWDGNNYERHGRNTFLYRTPKGAYFALYRTQWQGEHDTIEPLDDVQALDVYEGMAAHDMAEVPVEVAFPDLVVEEA
jgi:hypothetical protein